MNDFSDLSWEDMEHLVGELFEKKGYDVEVTKLTGDFGIDVWVEKNGMKIGIQVKHWNNDVGFDDVAKTLGSNLGKANRYIIISTKSGFTPQALEHQRQHSHLIELWDTSRFRKELDGLNIFPNSIKQPVTFRCEKTNSILDYGKPKREDSQKISKSTQISLYSFISGIIALFFTEHIWYISIPLFVIAIMIPLIKAMWQVADWAERKIR